MKPVVIFGTGELARIAALLLERDGHREVAGFTVDGGYLRGEREHLGHPLVSADEVARRFSPSECDMFVAVGYRRVNRDRAEICARARDMGYALPSFVHPTAHVDPTASLGDNCFVFERCIVQAFAEIGDNVIVWSGALVAHDSIIGDNCFLAPMSVVSGNVRVEKNAFIGINATVRDGICVAEGTVVGAGAVVKHDTVPGGIYSAAATLPIEGRHSSELDRL